MCWLARIKDIMLSIVSSTLLVQQNPCFFTFHKESLLDAMKCLLSCLSIAPKDKAFPSRHDIIEYKVDTP
jgi:hypothetical protein